ncbi:AMP-binding protein [Serratia ureilytica]
MIYTSGSTGKPKGDGGAPAGRAVVQRDEHRFNFSAADRWCLFHSFAFDFSVWEIWGAGCMAASCSSYRRRSPARRRIFIISSAAAASRY